MLRSIRRNRFLQVKTVRSLHLRSFSGSWDLEKPKRCWPRFGSRPLGECAVPLGISDSTDLTLEIVGQNATSEPFLLGAATSTETLVLVSERAMKVCRVGTPPDTLPVPFTGDLRALAPLGSHVVAAVLEPSRLEQVQLWDLAPDGASRSASISRLSRFSSFELIPMSDDRLWVIDSSVTFGFSSVSVSECSSGLLCEGFASSGLLEQVGRFFRIDGARIGAFGEGHLVVIDREGTVTTFEPTAPERPLLQAQIGGKIVTCGGKDARSVSISDSDFSMPWSTVLALTPRCSAIFEIGGDAWIFFDDETSIVVSADGSHRAADPSSIGWDPSIIAEFRQVERIRDEWVARDSDQTWWASDRQGWKPIYGEADGRHLPAAAVHDDSGTWVIWSPGIAEHFDRDLSSDARISLGLPGGSRIFGAARSTRSGDFWIIGSDGNSALSARIHFEGSTARVDEIPGTQLNAIAEIAPGLAIAVGRRFEAALIDDSGTVSAVEISFDDFATPGIEHMPTGNCDEGWRAVSSRGDGVAWLTGCVGALARARLTALGARATRLVGSAELFSGTTVGAPANLAGVASAGPGRAVILKSTNLLENKGTPLLVDTREGSDRADRIVFEQIEYRAFAESASPEGIGKGTSIFIDGRGRIVSLFQRSGELLVDAPSSPSVRWRVASSPGSGTVDGEGSNHHSPRGRTSFSQPLSSGPPASRGPDHLRESGRRCALRGREDEDGYLATRKRPIGRARACLHWRAMPRHRLDRPRPDP